MLTCRVDKSSLQAGVIIISSDYEVSTTPDMNNLVAHSYSVPGTEHSVIFDYNPERGRKYYGRIRCILSTGPIDWGEPSILTYEDETINFNMSIPSPINAPVLSTMFWREEHPHTNFSIFSSEYVVSGNSQHVATQWSITDIETGKCVLSKKSTVELLSLYVDIVLDYNKRYMVDAIFISDNDGYSPRGGLVFSTTCALVRDGTPTMMSENTDMIVYKNGLGNPNALHEWFLYDEEKKVTQTYIPDAPEVVGELTYQGVDTGTLSPVIITDEKHEALKLGSENGYGLRLNFSHEMVVLDQDLTFKTSDGTKKVILDVGGLTLTFNTTDKHDFSTVVVGNNIIATYIGISSTDDLVADVPVVYVPYFDLGTDTQIISVSKFVEMKSALDLGKPIIVNFNDDIGSTVTDIVFSTNDGRSLVLDVGRTGIVFDNTNHFVFTRTATTPTTETVELNTVVNLDTDITYLQNEDDLGFETTEITNSSLESVKSFTVAEGHARIKFTKDVVGKAGTARINGSSNGKSIDLVFTSDTTMIADKIYKFSLVTDTPSLLTVTYVGVADIIAPLSTETLTYDGIRRIVLQDTTISSAELSDIDATVNGGNVVIATFDEPLTGESVITLNDGTGVVNFNLTGNYNTTDEYTFDLDNVNGSEINLKGSTNPASSNDFLVVQDKDIAISYRYSMVSGEVMDSIRDGFDIGDVYLMFPATVAFVSGEEFRIISELDDTYLTLTFTTNRSLTTDYRLRLNKLTGNAIKDMGVVERFTDLVVVYDGNVIESYTKYNAFNETVYNSFLNGLDGHIYLYATNQDILVSESTKIIFHSNGPDDTGDRFTMILEITADIAVGDHAIFYPTSEYENVKVFSPVTDTNITSSYRSPILDLSPQGALSTSNIKTDAQMTTIKNSESNNVEFILDSDVTDGTLVSVIKSLETDTTEIEIEHKMSGGLGLPDVGGGFNANMESVYDNSNNGPHYYVSLSIIGDNFKPMTGDVLKIKGTTKEIEFNGDSTEVLTGVIMVDIGLGYGSIDMRNENYAFSSVVLTIDSVAGDGQDVVYLPSGVWDTMADDYNIGDAYRVIVNTTNDLTSELDREIILTDADDNDKTFTYVVGSKSLANNSCVLEYEVYDKEIYSENHIFHRISDYEVPTRNSVVVKTNAHKGFDSNVVPFADMVIANSNLEVYIRATISGDTFQPWSGDSLNIQGSEAGIIFDDDASGPITGDATFNIYNSDDDIYGIDLSSEFSSVVLTLDVLAGDGQDNIPLPAGLWSTLHSDASNSMSKLLITIVNDLSSDVGRTITLVDPDNSIRKITLTVVAGMTAGTTLKCRASTATGGSSTYELDGYVLAVITNYSHSELNEVVKIDVDFADVTTVVKNRSGVTNGVEIAQMPELIAMLTAGKLCGIEVTGDALVNNGGSYALFGGDDVVVIDTDSLPVSHIVTNYFRIVLDKILLGVYYTKIITVNAYDYNSYTVKTLTLDIDVNDYNDTGDLTITTSEMDVFFDNESFILNYASLVPFKSSTYTLTDGTRNARISVGSAPRFGSVEVPHIVYNNFSYGDNVEFDFGVAIGGYLNTKPYTPELVIASGNNSVIRKEPLELSDVLRVESGLTRHSVLGIDELAELKEAAAFEDITDKLVHELKPYRTIKAGDHVGGIHEVGSYGDTQIDSTITVPTHAGIVPYTAGVTLSNFTIGGDYFSSTGTVGTPQRTNPRQGDKIVIHFDSDIALNSNTVLFSDTSYNYKNTNHASGITGMTGRRYVFKILTVVGVEVGVEFIQEIAPTNGQNVDVDVEFVPQPIEENKFFSFNIGRANMAGSGGTIGGSTIQTLINTHQPGEIIEMVTYQNISCDTEETLTITDSTGAILKFENKYGRFIRYKRMFFKGSLVNGEYHCEMVCRKLRIVSKAMLEILVSVAGTDLTAANPIKLTTNENKPKLVTVETDSDIPVGSTVVGIYDTYAKHIIVPNLNDVSSRTNVIAHTGFLATSYGVYNDSTHQDATMYTNIVDAIALDKVINLKFSNSATVLTKHLTLTNGIYGRRIIFPLEVGLSVDSNTIHKYKLSPNSINQTEDITLVRTEDTGTSIDFHYPYPTTVPNFTMSTKSYLTVHNSMLMGRECKIIPSVSIPESFNPLVKMRYGNNNDGFILDIARTVIENEIMTFNATTTNLDDVITMTPTSIENNYDILGETIDAATPTLITTDIVSTVFQVSSFTGHENMPLLRQMATVASDKPFVLEMNGGWYPVNLKGNYAFDGGLTYRFEHIPETDSFEYKSEVVDLREDDFSNRLVKYVDVAGNESFESASFFDDLETIGDDGLGVPHLNIQLGNDLSANTLYPLYIKETAGNREIVLDFTGYPDLGNGDYVKMELGEATQGVYTPTQTPTMTMVWGVKLDKSGVTNKINSIGIISDEEFALARNKMNEGNSFSFKSTNQIDNSLTASDIIELNTVDGDRLTITLSGDLDAGTKYKATLGTSSYHLVKVSTYETAWIVLDAEISVPTDVDLNIYVTDAVYDEYVSNLNGGGNMFLEFINTTEQTTRAFTIRNTDGSKSMTINGDYDGVSGQAVYVGTGVLNFGEYRTFRTSMNFLVNVNHLETMDDLVVSDLVFDTIVDDAVNGKRIRIDIGNEHINEALPVKIVSSLEEINMQLEPLGTVGVGHHDFLLNSGTLMYHEVSKDYVDCSYTGDYIDSLPSEVLSDLEVAEINRCLLENTSVMIAFDNNLNGANNISFTNGAGDFNFICDVSSMTIESGGTYEFSLTGSTDDVSGSHVGVGVRRKEIIYSGSNKTVLDVQTMTQEKYDEITPLVDGKKLIVTFPNDIPPLNQDVLFSLNGENVVRLLLDGVGADIEAGSRHAFTLAVNGDLIDCTYVGLGAEDKVSSILAYTGYPIQPLAETVISETKYAEMIDMINNDKHIRVTFDNTIVGPKTNIVFREPVSNKTITLTVEDDRRTYLMGHEYDFEIDSAVGMDTQLEYDDEYIENVDGGLSNNEELTATTSFRIKQSYLERGKSYLLQGRMVDNDNPEARYCYFAFRTSGDSEFGLPNTFPYPLGYGQDATAQIDLKYDRE